MARAVGYLYSHVELFFSGAVAIFSLAVLCAASVARVCFFVGVAIRKSHREKNAQSLSFEITNNQWRLTTHAGRVVVGLAGEVVVWSWLIIIPVRELQSKTRYYLIALPDSLEKEPWRRLRVWLKTCL